MNKMLIGSHVQMKAPEYLVGSVKEALSYGSTTFMLYTGAPQNTRRTEIEKLRIDEAMQLMKDNDLDPANMIIHAPYIINPANSVKPEIGELAVSFLDIEAKRTAQMGARYMVLHPGSYTTTDVETGIRTTIEHLNQVVLPQEVTICLETMAGKGSEIGTTFEQIAMILNGLQQKENYGVCLDTCHIHDAGYDVRDFDHVLDEFDRIIGLNRLHVIHLNDSKNVMGARKDRHENIGRGEIGFEALCAIAHNPRTAHIPKILETPYIGGKAPYQQEIAFLREKKYDPSLL